MNNKVIAIVGPTASGKTSLAIKMAKELDTEIISADSRLVYSDMNIGTAKPTKEEQDGIKHYMIDIVEPTVDYSVADYVTQAEKHIKDILSNGKTPIVAGGTGLYFRILLENYKLPGIEANPQIREELNNMPLEDLYELLKKVDFKTAELLNKNDKVRIVRALEVYKILNKPFSEVKQLKDSDYEVEWISPPIESREWLYNRINLRVDEMIKQGLIEETKQLLDKYGRVKNITNTIGYQEIIAYFDGIMTLDEAIEKIKQNSRRYAKRQLTWFRRNPNLNYQNI